MQIIFKKIKNIFACNTLHLTLPYGNTLFLSIFFIPVIILLLEFGFRIIPLADSILIPSIDREISYAEIDLKFARLSKKEKTAEINCVLLGNSMMDFGVNPAILNDQKNIVGIMNPMCFNFALEAMMPETSSAIAEILKSKSNPRLIILGISPIDFSGEEYITRELVRSPWFLYQKGFHSLEGWLVENSAVFKYFISFLKYRNPEYRNELANMHLLIDENGYQKREPDKLIFQVQKIIKFPDFAISKTDLSAFQNILDLNSDETRIIIVEMPVHQDFLPYYVQGGLKGYEENFVEPISDILDEREIYFIRTKFVVESIVTPDGWIDYAHLNDKGAIQFSSWLAEELARIN